MHPHLSCRIIFLTSTGGREHVAISKMEEDIRTILQKIEDPVKKRAVFIGLLSREIVKLNGRNPIVVQPKVQVPMTSLFPPA